MNYADTLRYLYTRLPMFSRMGAAAYKKDLTNTLRLCEALGHPQQRFKSIHVAGTNGKGSVSHMLAAIFGEAGYKTGLYTSPHLYDFRERIRLNGQPVPEAFVASFVHRLRDLIEETEPSFFEITVAMAFQFFAEQGVDIAIVEVGLGGRLDSTNIITPELSVITNIGWDHMDLLGDSLEAIAGEKAGIIKQGVAVVVGEVLPQTASVFRHKAEALDAPLVYAAERFQVLDYQLHQNHLQVQYRQSGNGLRTITTDLPGLYQVQNVRTVLAACELLQKDWRLSHEQIETALRSVKERTGLMGRWEVLQQKPAVVLEVAHNKDGIERMLAHINTISFGQLHLVFGMVKDKDTAAVLSLLPASARYYFTQAGSPRALPAADLQLAAANAQLAGEKFEEVNAALRAALQQAAPNDLIVVCGSIFLVAEVDRSVFPLYSEALPSRNKA